MAKDNSKQYMGHYFIVVRIEAGCISFIDPMKDDIQYMAKSKFEQCRRAKGTSQSIIFIDFEHVCSVPVENLDQVQKYYCKYCAFQVAESFLQAHYKCCNYFIKLNEKVEMHAAEQKDKLKQMQDNQVQSHITEYPEFSSLFDKITVSNKEELAGFAAGTSMINTCATTDDNIDEIAKLKKDLHEAKEEYVRFMFIVGSSADRGDQRGGYQLTDKYFEHGLYDDVINKWRDEADRPWVNTRSRYMESLLRKRRSDRNNDLQANEVKNIEAQILPTLLSKPKTVLETKRNIQRDDSLVFIHERRKQLATVEEWLGSVAQQSKKGQLKSVGIPICDGIVYPRCPLIFGDDIKKHDEKLGMFLKQHQIPVRSVGNVATKDKGVVFVYLVDSDNAFSSELITNLNRSLDELAVQIREAVPSSSPHGRQRIGTAIANLYIRQIDYTKDFLGFFMVLSLASHNFDILRELASKIGMSLSKNHSQLLTSIQFESSKDGTRSERLKVYNKLVHLLTTVSFKSKLSMGTKKLFKAPLAFHQKKIQPSFKDGLTRIELSTYFNSVQHWQEKTFDVRFCDQRISDIEKALQSVQEQLIYQVNFKIFWDSFWISVDNATTLITLEHNLWTIAYAYSTRSYLFVGHHTDRHNKSGAQLTFLQRFAGAKTLVRVNNGNETKEFLIQKYGHSRQIPIDSLNVVQYELHIFPIDLGKWFYNLSDQQLDRIYFTCENNQEEFDGWFGQNLTTATTPAKPMQVSKSDLHMNDGDEEQLSLNVFQQEYKESVLFKSDNVKKRSKKKEEKEEMKRDGGDGESHAITRTDNKRRPYVLCPLCHKEVRLDNLQKHQRGSLCQE